MTPAAWLGCNWDLLFDKINLNTCPTCFIRQCVCTTSDWTAWLHHEKFLFSRRGSTEIEHESRHLEEKTEAGEIRRVEVEEG